MPAFLSSKKLAASSSSKKKEKKIAMQTYIWPTVALRRSVLHSKMARLYQELGFLGVPEVDLAIKSGGGQHLAIWPICYCQNVMTVLQSLHTTFAAAAQAMQLQHQSSQVAAWGKTSTAFGRQDDLVKICCP